MATASDDFDRANGAIGSNWTQASGTWTVSSNAANQTNAAGQYESAIYTATTPASNDYSVTAQVRNNGGSYGVGVMARGSTSAVTGYALVGFGGDQFYLIRLNAGVETVLTSGGFAACAANTTYTVEIEVNGTTIRGRINGGSWTSVTDSNISSGGWGLACYGSVTGGGRWMDSFGAADLGGGGPAPTTEILGVFDPNAVRVGWFDPAAQPIGWFDDDLITEATGGGSSVALVASAYSLGITLAAAPVARSLRAGAVALGLAATGAAMARQLRASEVSRSRVVAPLPVGRGLAARTVGRSGASGAGAVGRALVAYSGGVSRTSAVSPISRALSAHVVSVGQEWAGFPLVVLLDLVATAYSAGASSATTPVLRQLRASDISHGRSFSPARVSRALSAISVSRSSERGSSLVARALASRALTLSTARGASVLARAMRASGLSVASGNGWTEIEAAQWSTATARGSIVILVPAGHVFDASPSADTQLVESPAVARVEHMRPGVSSRMDVVMVESEVTRRA